MSPRKNKTSGTAAAAATSGAGSPLNMNMKADASVDIGDNVMNRASKDNSQVAPSARKQGKFADPVAEKKARAQDAKQLQMLEAQKRASEVKLLKKEEPLPKKKGLPDKVQSPKSPTMVVEMIMSPKKKRDLDPAVKVEKKTSGQSPEKKQDELLPAALLERAELRALESARFSENMKAWNNGMHVNSITSRIDDKRELFKAVREKNSKRNRRALLTALEREGELTGRLQRKARDFNRTNWLRKERDDKDEYKVDLVTREDEPSTFYSWNRSLVAKGNSSSNEKRVGRSRARGVSRRGGKAARKMIRGFGVNNNNNLFETKTNNFTQPSPVSRLQKKRGQRQRALSNLGLLNTVEPEKFHSPQALPGHTVTEVPAAVHRAAFGLESEGRPVSQSGKMTLRKRFEALQKDKKKRWCEGKAANLGREGNKLDENYEEVKAKVVNPVAVFGPETCPAEFFGGDYAKQSASSYQGFLGENFGGLVSHSGHRGEGGLERGPAFEYVQKNSNKLSDGVASAKELTFRASGPLKSAEPEKKVERLPGNGEKQKKTSSMGKEGSWEFLNMPKNSGSGKNGGGLKGKGKGSVDSGKNDNLLGGKKNGLKGEADKKGQQEKQQQGKNQQGKQQQGKNQQGKEQGKEQQKKQQGMEQQKKQQGMEQQKKQQGMEQQKKQQGMEGFTMLKPSGKEMKAGKGMPVTPTNAQQGGQGKGKGKGKW